MTYGGGGGSEAVVCGSILNLFLSSFSSRSESWIEDPDDPSVIRPESVELRRLGRPAKNGNNNMMTTMIDLLLATVNAENN